MSTQRQTAKVGQTVAPAQGRLLQRVCACGKHTGGGECAECKQKREGALQRQAADLSIGPAGDRFEQEAERVAAAVVGGGGASGTAGALTRLQRRATGDGSLGTAPPIVHDVLRSPGQPLDHATRSFMEPRFGQDFSAVRLHTDAPAAESARAVNALAYTVGRDVVFGAGQHQPQSSAGRRLMAHELAHVVQQAGRPFDQSVALCLDDPAANLEGEAASNAKRALTNARYVTTQENPGGIRRLQRQMDTSADYARSTRFPLIDSMSSMLTLDGFASDSAELTTAHRKAISDYKTRVTQMLKQYPDSFITVAGHTDATDTEEHNRALGQQRAEAVMAALGEGEFGISTAIMHAYSLGKTQLIVETKEREPRNRRVEVSFTARSFSFRKPPVFTATPELQKGSGYVMPPRPRPIPAPPPKPDFFKPIPPAPKGGAESRSVLDLVNEKIVDPVVKGLTEWLPKGIQKKIVDLAHEGVEKGTTAALEAALKDSGLTEAAQRDIIKAMEKAIQLKDKPLDRKPEGEGSPWRQEPEPSHIPEKPDDSQWK